MRCDATAPLASGPPMKSQGMKQSSLDLARGMGAQVWTDESSRRARYRLWPPAFTLAGPAPGGEMLRANRDREVR